MAQWKCPTCGNIADVGGEDLVTVCPYCRTCYTANGVIIQEHYLVPAYYTSTHALENLVLWVKKQIGAEEDIPLHLEVVSAFLDYYPFWHVEVSCETEFSGVGEDATYSGPVGPNTFKAIHYVSKPESGRIDRGFSLTYPASSAIPRQLLDYGFPTRSRKYFSESYAKESGGKVHNGVLTRESVEERARADTERILSDFVRREIFQVNTRHDKTDLSSIFYLHVPIWQIQYKYFDRNYEAYVDASTGRIIHATYPVSIKHRTFSGILAATHAAAGLLLGIFLGSSNTLPAVGVAVSLLSIAGVFTIRAAWPGRGAEKAK